jgi:hypothetical protein
VSSKMVGEVAVSREGTVAVGKVAHKRFLAIVDAFMRLQVSLLCETLSTAGELANEWFFANLQR